MSEFFLFMFFGVEFSWLTLFIFNLYHHFLGTVIISAGQATGEGTGSAGGSVEISAGSSPSIGGNISLLSGSGGIVSGNVLIASSVADKYAKTGDVSISSGSSGSASSGSIYVSTGDTKDSDAGAIHLSGGTSEKGRGGDIKLTGGESKDAGIGGNALLRKCASHVSIHIARSIVFHLSRSYYFNEFTLNLLVNQRVVREVLFPLRHLHQGSAAEMYLLLQDLLRLMTRDQYQFHLDLLPMERCLVRFFYPQAVQAQEVEHCNWHQEIPAMQVLLVGVLLFQQDLGSALMVMMAVMAVISHLKEDRREVKVKPILVVPLL